MNKQNMTYTQDRIKKINAVLGKNVEVYHQINGV